MRRTRGREIALQALYQKELNPGIGQRQLNTFLRHRLKHTPSLIDYSKALINGVDKHMAEIDKRLTLVADNWRLERMPILDKNILRIGLYEIQTGNDGTPPAVAVNEAVNLAKRYGSVQSGKFINGILDQFLPGRPAAFKFGDPLPDEPSTEPESATPDDVATETDAASTAEPVAEAASSTEPVAEAVPSETSAEAIPANPASETDAATTAEPVAETTAPVARVKLRSNSGAFDELN